MSTIAIVCRSPVLAITTWPFAKRMGRPILFTQRRPGLDGKSFAIVNSRTKTEPLGELGSNPDADGVRLTPFGRRLRATSGDGLAELLNVIRGDMSLVVSRPLLEEYLPYYSARERLRFRVRTGITGRAQISGRNALARDERLDHDDDVWYVEHCSIALDLKILARTAARILRREDVRPDHSNLALHRRHQMRGSTR